MEGDEGIILRGICPDYGYSCMLIAVRSQKGNNKEIIGVWTCLVTLH